MSLEEFGTFSVYSNAACQHPIFGKMLIKNDIAHKSKTVTILMFCQSIDNFSIKKTCEFLSGCIKTRCFSTSTSTSALQILHLHFNPKPFEICEENKTFQSETTENSIQIAPNIETFVDPWPKIFMQMQIIVQNLSFWQNKQKLQKQNTIFC